jgi:hypothetical protein
VDRRSTPVFLAPVFNKYVAGAGRARAQAHPGAGPRQWHPDATDVYEFDASRQSKRVSANVSGFGSTLRISLNDNLTAPRPRLPEIEAVMGHEMGHYVLNHVPKLDRRARRPHRAWASAFVRLVVRAPAGCGTRKGGRSRAWPTRPGCRCFALLFGAFTLATTPVVKHDHPHAGERRPTSSG